MAGCSGSTSSSAARMCGCKLVGGDEFAVGRGGDVEAVRARADPAWASLRQRHALAADGCQVGLRIRQGEDERCSSGTSLIYDVIVPDRTIRLPGL